VSLVIDGNRSLKWLTAGRKLLELIRSLDIPAKQIIRDGFRIKAWQHRDLSKITITAPMGAAVLCVTDAGMDLMTADSLYGPFTAARSVFVADPPALPTGYALTYDFYSGEEVATIEFSPDSSQPDPRILPGVVYTPPAAVLIATAFEFFCACVNSKTAAGRFLFEVFSNFYALSGETQNRTGHVMEYSSTISGTNIQLLPAKYLFRSVQHQSIGSIYLQTVDKMVGAIATFTKTQPAATVSYTMVLGSNAFDGAPGQVVEALLENTALAEPVGSYAFSVAQDAGVVFLHGAKIDLIQLYNTPEGDALEAYFASNPSEKKWVILFSIQKNGLTYLHSSEQFVEILDEMSSGTVIGTGGVIDYAKAQRMFSLLFPRPNYQSWAPFDSTMFHGPNPGVDPIDPTTGLHENNIYTWTRRHGGFKFSASGLSRITLVVPPEVENTQWVRPDITHAGEGIYLCVCISEGVRETDPEPSVLAVYKGSPFSTWEKLSDPPLVVPEAGADEVQPKLVYVRPVKVSVEEVTLLGVLMVHNSVTLADEFFFATFQSGGWSKLGRLTPPVGPANWSACVFGAGKMSVDLINYPSPPPVLRRMIQLTDSMYDEVYL